LYRQNKLGLSYALSLSPSFSIGISINYNSIQLGEGLGMEYAFYPDLGLNYKPTDKLNISIQFQNLTLSKKVKQLDELWPVSGSLGFVYTINEKLLIGARGNVYANQPMNINSGLEYQFTPQFSLRIGYASQPASASMGIGFKLKNIQIDLASSYLANLGFTPSINIVYINGN
jgi:long-subunit fatty acid transport protein